MLIYGNIRDLAYFRYKFNIIFGGHFDFFITKALYQAAILIFFY